MTATLPTTAQPVASPASKVAGLPFARLVRIEIGKAVDTRSARWLLAVTALATIGLMLVPVLNRHHVHQSYDNYVGFPVFAMTTLLPIVALLTLTTEWTQRTVLTTFTQEPRRSRVMAAKLLTSGVLALAASAFVAAVIASAVGLVHATGRDITGHVGWQQVIGIPLFVLLNVLLGAAFGALLQNSAAAIVALFAVPIGLGFLGNAVGAVHDWVDPDTAFNHVLGGEWSGHLAQIAAPLVLWVVLPIVGGFVRTVKRQIT